MDHQISDIISLVKEYNSQHPKSLLKRQLNNKLRTLLLQNITKSNVNQLLEALINLRKESAHQFSVCCEAILHFKQVLLLFGVSEKIEFFIENIVQSVMEIVAVIGSSGTSVTNKEFSVILRHEQILCRLLQTLSLSLSNTSTLLCLFDIINDIAQKVRFVDCITSASMLSILILRNIEQDNFVVKLHNLITHQFQLNDETDVRSLEYFFDSMLSEAKASGKIRQAFLFGLMGILTPVELIGCSKTDDQPDLALFLLTNLLTEHDLSDTATKLLQARSLQIWFQKAVELTPYLFDEKNSTLHAYLSGPMDSTMDFVFTHQDDPVDVIKHAVRAVFNSAVTCHHNLCKACPTCPVAKDFLDKVIFQSWDQRGKYSLLGTLAEQLGAQSVLNSLPQLPKDLIKCANEHSLATHVADLYSKVLHSHVTCDLSEGSQLDFPFWFDPILESLQSNQDTVRLAIVQYFIPKLAEKFPTGLLYMIRKYNSGDLHNVGAHLACVRGALSKGLNIPAICTQSGDHQLKLWRHILPIDILKTTFSAQDDEIRLDALALICDEIKKSKKPVNKADLDLILEFTSKNLASRNPSFRQKFASLLEAVCQRVIWNEEALVKRRQTRKAETSDEQTILEHQNFITSLVTLLVGNLHTGASFSRRTTVLGLFSHIIGLLVDQDKTGIYTGKPLLSQSHVLHLLTYLGDSYATNRSSTLNILITSDSLRLLEASTLTYLYTKAWIMARSSHPQDCPTATFLFRILLHLPQSLLTSTVLPGFADLASHEPFKESDYILCGSNAAIGFQSICAIYFVELLLNALESVVETGRRDLVKVSLTHPFYSILHCISDLVEYIDFDHLSPATFARLLDNCYQVGSLVAPLVSSASPEGHLPLGPGLELGHLLHTSTANDDNDKSNGCPSNDDPRLPEALVLCCWRSTKEAALLLGKLASLVLRRDCSHFSVNAGNVLKRGEQKDTESGSSENMNDERISAISGQREQLLPVDKIEEMGRFFRTQLLESRHRGAFELASVGFTQLCEALWRVRNLELHCLPVVWLKEVLRLLLSPSEGNLCATRRSAGLPYFIQAVIISEKTAGISVPVTLTSVMTSLLEIVTEKAIIESSGEPETLIHALNILRALYRDANLGEEMTSYIPHGLKAAILGFAAQSWSVRNSSTMLFSSLMQRIFGVNRSKDLTSRKNCLSSRVFFTRFEGLYEFLLIQLKAELANVEHSLQPKLYPILLILGRLMPPTMEQVDTSFRLDAFLPLVIKCGSSPVLRIRLLAARSLTSLLYKNQLSDKCHELFTTLPATTVKSTNHNTLHGTLLQIRCLLEQLKNPPVTLVHSALNFAWIGSSLNQSCDIIRAEYLGIITGLANFFLDNHSVSTRELIWQSHMTIFISGDDVVRRLPGRPGSSDAQVELTQLTYSLLDRELEVRQDAVPVLLAFLNSDVTEVRLSVLNFLVNHDSSIVVLRKLEPSTESYPKLFHWLHRWASEELNPNCLVKWFQLLSEQSLIDSCQSNTDILQKLVSTCLSRCVQFPHEEVISASLTLIAKCLGAFAAAAYEGYIDSSTKVAMLACVKRLNSACRFDETAALRMVAVSGLRYLVPLMMDGNNFFDSEIYLLWECWFTGLFDDDTDVRVSAANLLPYFNDKHGELLSPCIVFAHAVDLLMSTLSENNCCSLVGAIIEWMLNGMSTEEKPFIRDGDNFRVFDRGEMNISRDDIIFVDRLSLALVTTSNTFSSKHCCLAVMTRLVAGGLTQLTERGIFHRANGANGDFLSKRDDRIECLLQIYRVDKCLSLIRSLYSNWVPVDGSMTIPRI